MFFIYSYFQIYLSSCAIYFVLTLFFNGRKQLQRIDSKINHEILDEDQVKFSMIYGTVMFLIMHSCMCLLWPLAEIFGCIIQAIIMASIPKSIDNKKST